MKVSFNWLKEYVDLEGITPEDLAEKLTRSGVEVEGIEYRNKGVSSIVVGFVAEREKHPDADKLNVCQVDVGAPERLQIVCGAANVAAGQKVVVSIVGAQLPGGVKIKKAKLRGVESQGMICSARELGMNDKLLPKDQQEGILVLPQDAKAGQNALAFLGLDDAVLELSLTPNRSDCLSMLGVAYEVAAILNRSVRLPELAVNEGSETIADKVEIKIDAPEHCSEYAARLISNIQIGPSPQWMQNRLIAAGIRPISNLVDITNYVMLEHGQPLHAFDFSQVQNGKIVVRLALDGELFTTLDDVERKLDSEMLLITDGSKPIAIAGVMGGANSEVTDQTTTVLLESAHFSGPSVRKTAKKLGLRSEASLRFEKEADPEALLPALDRAAALMVELAGGTVAKGIVDQKVTDLSRKHVTLRLERLNEVLGTTITLEQVEEIITRLNFSFEKEGTAIRVEVPFRRQDITREVDLIEEVARLHGYEHIPTTLPEGMTTRGKRTPFQEWERDLRNSLTGAGLYEVSTYSFSNEEIMYDLASPFKETRAIPLSMPMSEEYSHLRVNLLPHLLKTASYNRNRQTHDVAVFEIGRVFLTEEEQLTVLPEEKLCLAGLLTGNWVSGHWLKQDEKIDFYAAKGIIDLILTVSGVKADYMPNENLKGMHPGRTAEILVNGQSIGFLGQVHPRLQQKYDIAETYVFNLDLEILFAKSNTTSEYQVLPKFPASTRDLSIVVDEQVPASEIERNIVETAGPLLESVTLFDVFTGEKIGKGKRSLAFSLIYRNLETTLTDQEVNAIHDRVVQVLSEKYQAELRY
jgi:phenylalanyl-tRNA synthetase beta chain